MIGTVLSADELAAVCRQEILKVDRFGDVNVQTVRLITYGDSDYALCLRLLKYRNLVDLRAVYLNQRFTVLAPDPCPMFWTQVARAQARWCRDLSTALGSKNQKRALKQATQIARSDPSDSRAGDRYTEHLGLFVINGEIRTQDEPEIGKPLREAARAQQPRKRKK